MLSFSSGLLHLPVDGCQGLLVFSPSPHSSIAWAGQPGPWAATAAYRGHRFGLGPLRPSSAAHALPPFTTAGPSSKSGQGFVTAPLFTQPTPHPSGGLLRSARRRQVIRGVSEADIIDTSRKRSFLWWFGRHVVTQQAGRRSTSSYC